MDCLPTQDEDGPPWVCLRPLQDSTRRLNETKTMYGGVQYVAEACRFQYNDTSYMETVLPWQFAPECGHGPHPLPLARLSGGAHPPHLSRGQRCKGGDYLYIIESWVGKDRFLVGGPGN